MIFHWDPQPGAAVFGLVGDVGYGRIKIVGHRRVGHVRFKKEVEVQHDLGAHGKCRETMGSLTVDCGCQTRFEPQERCRPFILFDKAIVDRSDSGGEISNGVEPLDVAGFKRLS